jgi:hypothetical protein
MTVRAVGTGSGELQDIVRTPLSGDPVSAPIVITLK